MLSSAPTHHSPDAIAPVSPAMNHDLSKIFDMLQGAATPHSTPFMDTNDYRTLEEIITSPEFTSPLFEDTPNLSDASPFTPSSSSTRQQTSPALFDYGDTSSGGIPLFGPSPIVINSNQNAVYGTPNLDSLQLQSAHLGFQSLDSLLPMSGSPISPSADTRDLFSPTTSPLFTDAHSVRPDGVRSVSDPGKRTQPTGHRKNLSPEQLLDVDAPTQQRNYYGPSATSRKPVPAGFEERRAKIVAKRRRGLGADGEEVSEDVLLNAAVEDKRRANTVAARRSRQRKLEYVKTLEDQLAEKSREVELWKERAIAAEGIVRQLEGKE
ncbi:BZIP transcription factor [Rhizoctonia solani AG-3 Rhs1AP]|nr:BZIP transcription factor [Rhizoctonia solani AG-3 Rhs1AP]